MIVYKEDIIEDFIELSEWDTEKHGSWEFHSFDGGVLTTYNSSTFKDALYDIFETDPNNFCRMYYDYVVEGFKIEYGLVYYLGESKNV